MSLVILDKKMSVKLNDNLVKDQWASHDVWF